jgi:hypothetical protein
VGDINDMAWSVKHKVRLRPRFKGLALKA